MTIQKKDQKKVKMQRKSLTDKFFDALESFF